MARIAVARLKLAVPDAALAVRGRRLAEEALRCAGVDGGARYLVIRRARLGVLPGGEGPAPQMAWTARTASVLRAQAGTAVHASTPGAEAADAVWFNSEADARAALVLLLVRGRRPLTWFWRLAVPEWTGGDWATVAPVLLRTLTALPGGCPALARVVVTALLTGDGPVLLSAVGDAPAVTLLPQWTPDSGHAATGRSAPGPPSFQSEAAHPAENSAARSAAARVLRALSPSVRPALASVLVAVGPTSPRARFVTTQVALAAAPELAATPRLLVAVARELAVEVASEAAAPVLSAERMQRAARSAFGESFDEAQPAQAPKATDGADGRSADAISPAFVPSRTAAHDATTAPDPTPVSPVLVTAERRSAGAGLFLLVRPLVWLGLPAWLERNPEHAGAGFAWLLLDRIAARIRIPAEDPVRAILSDACGETMNVDDGHDAALDAWRIGLDRWLRRRARITLAATVRRAGWLLADQEQVTIRFPLDAADIRLRRLALDVDPGWVPWLGRTVAFLYRDAPEERDGP